ncbi:unnamed protein product [Caenorhabditis sp. 36 PRJEB53466]|nr:unnamed protein product [Caenorhabditis sp. 36 PRJEB53466]
MDPPNIAPILNAAANALVNNLTGSTDQILRLLASHTLSDQEYNYFGHYLIKFYDESRKQMTGFLRIINNGDEDADDAGDRLSALLAHVLRALTRIETAQVHLQPGSMYYAGFFRQVIDVHKALHSYYFGNGDKDAMRQVVCTKAEPILTQRGIFDYSLGVHLVLKYITEFDQQSTKRVMKIHKDIKPISLRRPGLDDFHKDLLYKVLSFQVNLDSEWRDASQRKLRMTMRRKNNELLDLLLTYIQLDNEPIELEFLRAARKSAREAFEATEAPLFHQGDKANSESLCYIISYLAKEVEDVMIQKRDYARINFHHLDYMYAVIMLAELASLNKEFAGENAAYHRAADCLADASYAALELVENPNTLEDLFDAINETYTQFNVNNLGELFAFVNLTKICEELNDTEIPTKFYVDYDEVRNKLKAAKETLLQHFVPVNRDGNGRFGLSGQQYVACVLANDRLVNPSEFYDRYIRALNGRPFWGEAVHVLPQANQLRAVANALRAFVNQYRPQPDYFEPQANHNGPLGAQNEPQPIQVAPQDDHVIPHGQMIDNNPNNGINAPANGNTINGIAVKIEIED